MADLLDGATTPWDFISGDHEATHPHPVVLEAVRRRREAVAAPATYTGPQPYRARRVVAVGRGIAGDLAAQFNSRRQA